MVLHFSLGSLYPGIDLHIRSKRIKRMHFKVSKKEKGLVISYV